MDRRIDTDDGGQDESVDLVIFDNSEHGQIDDDERRERRER